MLLAIKSFREGNFGDASRCFVAAMQDDSLRSFEDYINNRPEAPILKNADPSQNTINPSLASAFEAIANGDPELGDQVARITAIFRGEASATMLDDDESISEAFATDDEDDDEGFEFEVSASSSIKLKSDVEA